MTGVRVLGVVLIVAAGMVSPGSSVGAAQPPADQLTDNISAEALAQISALIEEKESRTAAQQKIDSQLLYEQRMESGQPVANGIWAIETDLPYAADGHLVVDVQTRAEGVAARLAAAGIEVVSASADGSTLRAHIDVDQVEMIAADPDVVFIQAQQAASTSGLGGQATSHLITGPTGVGSRSSEGDVTHLAFAARGAFHIDGTGIKIGVLSNGVRNLAASQAAGDLGPVTIIGPAAPCLATAPCDEGTATLEIIHDLAPGAQLFFASAFVSITSFADNIRALRAAGCDIIVDDVSYFVETPFQDGQVRPDGQPQPTNTNGGAVIQAVKEVTASGALYFSAAGNSGNLDAGTAGTWEGDFVDGGPLLPAIASIGATARINNFGGRNFNLLTVPDPGGAPISLYWSDPLGASSNDYDLFRLNAAGTSVLGGSTNVQNGTQDPYEQVTQSAASPRLVIVKKATAAPRFLHLNANHGQLSGRTAGSTHGHAAVTGDGAYGVAATPAVGPFPQAFNSGNHVEPSSSDGPRRIFYHGDGTPITPGNVSSTGGQVLQKPDITAADGVSVSGVGGFTTPFFGTSAAAAHAAAIAALVKSANAALTSAEVRTILTDTAIDIDTPGVDRNSGAGIIMARSAVLATGASGTAFLQIENVQVAENPGNSNGAIESGEGGLLSMTLTNYGVAPATGIAVSLTSRTAGVTVGRANTTTYPDLAPTASASNSSSRFTMASDYPCGQPAAFLFKVTYDGGPAVPPFPFTIPIASPPFNVTTTLDLTAPPSAPGVVGSTGLQAGRLFRDVVGSTCGTPKTFPGIFSVGTRRFDAFAFNTCPQSGPSCVTVTVQGPAAGNLLAAGYTPTFDPNNLATNYAADPGGSGELTTFSFKVAGAGQPFAVDVAEVNAGGGLGTLYDLTVSGACYGSCDPPNRLPVAKAKNVIAAASDLCVADASIDDGSADPDGDTVTVVQAPPPPYTLGTTSVLLTATDPKGAFSEAIGEVTVLDRTPPSIACPAPITTFTDPGVCSAVVAFGLPAASDLCSNPTAVSYDIASGSSFPLGATTVKGKATDAAGNAAVCTTLVTVVDNQAPTITGLSVSGTPQSSGKNKLIDFTVDYTATDLCGPASSSLSVTFTNPRTRRVEDGNHGRNDGQDKRGGAAAAAADDDQGEDTPAFVIVDNHHVRLRVDNSGPVGRIYTITVTAVDAAGNTSSSSINVQPTNEGH
jgi:subtilase family protein/HYR domain-containing protein